MWPWRVKIPTQNLLRLFLLQMLMLRIMLATVCCRFVDRFDHKAKFEILSWSQATFRSWSWLLFCRWYFVWSDCEVRHPRKNWKSVWIIIFILTRTTFIATWPNTFPMELRISWSHIWSWEQSINSGLFAPGNWCQNEPWPRKSVHCHFTTFWSDCLINRQVSYKCSKLYL